MGERGRPRNIDYSHRACIECMRSRQEAFFRYKNYAHNTEMVHRSNFRVLTEVANSETLVDRDFLEEFFEATIVSNLSQLVVYAHPICDGADCIDRNSSTCDEENTDVGQRQRGRPSKINVRQDPEYVPSEYLDGALCISCVESVLTSKDGAQFPEDFRTRFISDLKAYLKQMDQTRFDWSQIVRKFANSSHAELARSLQPLLPISCDGHKNEGIATRMT